MAARLARRLFDAGMPPEAIEHYMKLSKLCRTPKQATENVLGPIDALVKANASRGTPRNRDTLSRMREAIDGLRNAREGAKKQEDRTGKPALAPKSATSAGNDESRLSQRRAYPHLSATLPAPRLPAGRKTLDQPAC